MFTGFGSYDGTNWTQLGAATIAMPSQIYLGLAVASHNTNQTTTAQFVNYETTPDQRGGGHAWSIPTNRWGRPAARRGIVISEIMWKPAPRTDGNNVEFIELYNSNPLFQDISGYQVTCADMNYTFPAQHADSRRRFLRRWRLRRRTSQVSMGMTPMSLGPTPAASNIPRRSNCWMNRPMCC